LLEGIFANFLGFSTSTNPYFSVFWLERFPIKDARCQPLINGAKNDVRASVDTLGFNSLQMETMFKRSPESILSRYFSFLWLFWGVAFQNISSKIKKEPSVA